MRSFGVVTFGCRVNQADSLGFERDLRAAGLVPAPPETADVVIVNTCSVTASADQGARQALRRIHRENPTARLVVTGCYATRAASDLATLPGVTSVVPNEAKDHLATHLLQVLRPDGAVSGDGPCGAHVEPGVAGRTAWTLRVQTGCAEPCAYCIIPLTRGQPRSRRLDDVVAEVSRVAAAGFREVAITGVHLGSWGRDLGEGQSLLTLLQVLDRHPAPVVFRVSSLEPMDCTDEVRRLLVSSGRFAPHLHLPVQHASERMLRAMRRPYSIAYVADLVEFVARTWPHVSLGTDVLVGFPGEREEDHRGNAAWLASSPLTHLHVFPYSDRPGTAASAMGEKVHGTVVRDRTREIRDIGAGLTRRFHALVHGTTRPGLTLDDGTVVVTDNYLKATIAPGLTRNVRVRVRLDTGGGVVRGEVVEIEPGQPPISEAMRWAGDASAPSTIS